MKSINPKAKPYLLFGLLLLIFRAYINFSTELVPGLNGGYYPLQVRTILENGSLGFPDMPLYFYLNAFAVQVLQGFTNFPLDTLIINTTKVFDTVLLPLTIIPLFWIFWSLIWYQPM